MKYKYFVSLFIIIVCSLFLYQRGDTHPNNDERASLVIAMGKFTQLSDITRVTNEVVAADYLKFSSESLNFCKVFRSVVEDNSNGVAYYFLLSAWIKLTGLNNFWLRFLSVVFAGINLILVFALSGRFQNRYVFQWFAIIQTSINPIFYEDAVLIRSYMLSLCFVLLSIYFLIKIISEKQIRTSHFVFYFISIILALASHYFTAAVVLAEFVFIIFRSREIKNKMQPFLIGFACVAVAGAGWFYLIYPIGFQNLILLQKVVLHLANMDNEYLFSFRNLIREWLNVATYFVGFSTDSMGPGRIILKFIAMFIVLGSVVALVRVAKTAAQKLLLTIIVWSSVFISCQSMVSGHLTNFIPHYLFFLMPFIIFGINVVVSNWYSHVRNFKVEI